MWNPVDLRNKSNVRIEKILYLKEFMYIVSSGEFVTLFPPVKHIIYLQRMLIFLLLQSL